jgi:hypothetical protein
MKRAPMPLLRDFFAALNRWQDRYRLIAVPWAVNKKFGNDQANLLVVALG